MTAAWGFRDRATQQPGGGKRWNEFTEGREGSEGRTEKGRVLPWFAVGLFIVAYIGHLLCSFAREEGAMRAHNGCARFCGDEWRSDWRISIRPRALLQGRDLLEQKAIADARTIDWQKQGECLNPKVVFLLWRRQTGDRAALVVRVGYAF